MTCWASDQVTGRGKVVVKRRREGFVEVKCGPSTLLDGINFAPPPAAAREESSSRGTARNNETSPPQTQPLMMVMINARSLSRSFKLIRVD